jgi:hypothetical protein
MMPFLVVGVLPMLEIQVSVPTHLYGVMFNESSRETVTASDVEMSN